MSFKLFGAVVHPPRYVQQPGLTVVGFAIKTTVAFVVRQIQVVRIIGRNFAALGTLRIVPADEIHGVGKVGSTAPVVAAAALVLTPGFILYLGEAVGAALARPREDPKNFSPGRLGFWAEAGFLIHNRHHYRNAGAPTSLSAPRIFVPAPLLIKQVANIIAVFGGNEVQPASTDSAKSADILIKIDIDCYDNS